MEESKEIKELQKPFEPQDIEWRVQQSGVKNGKPWAMVIPYITNRAIQKRFDEVFGVLGWENTFEQTTPTINGKADKQRTVYGWKCGITIFNEGQRITKWDGAEETDIEPLKGGMSNSMKRAAVQFGVGRYLYHLEPVFAICVIVNSRRDCNDDYPNYGSKKEKNSNVWVNFAWGNPPLPSWALPNSDFEKFLTPIKKAEAIAELKKAFETAYKQAEASGKSHNTELAIEAKDQRKAFIIDLLQKESAKNLLDLTNWLKEQVVSFNVIPNESAVTSFYNAIKDSLKAKAKAFQIDDSDLLGLFKNSYKKRIEELQPKKEGEQ